MKNRKPFFILIPITIFFIIGFVVMILWNNLIPEIFGLKSITYLQALGLFFLSRILFGSFGGKKPSFVGSNNKDKIINMNAEEREKFKEEWKNRCK